MKFPGHSRQPDSDQSFDDRAVHLQKNIYGSDKGKLRLLILQRDLAAIIRQRQGLSVFDAGCGTGLMSEWVALHRHRLFACDSSPVMIEEAKKRLSGYQHTTLYCGAIQTVEAKQRYDVVMCHAVLEWVKDQTALLSHLVRHLKPGGYLSLMFYNAWAREMAQLVYGNFDYIDKNYQVRQRVKLTPHWPASPDVVESLLARQKMHLVKRSGIRVFYDILRNRDHYQIFRDDIIRHELRVSQQHPYWQMGRYVHFLLRKEA